MAKLTFNSVVYLKSTLEKVYVRAIISHGQNKTYKLSNGMKVSIDELITELPVDKNAVPEVDVVPVAETKQVPEIEQSPEPITQKKAAKKPTKKA